MKSLQLSITNYHLSMHDQLPFINAAAKWQMLSGKLMANVKREMENASEGGLYAC
jgi:hypothetical protein